MTDPQDYNDNLEDSDGAFDAIEKALSESQEDSGDSDSFGVADDSEGDSLTDTDIVGDDIDVKKVKKDKDKSPKDGQDDDEEDDDYDDDEPSLLYRVIINIVAAIAVAVGVVIVTFLVVILFVDEVHNFHELFEYFSRQYYS